MKQTIKTPRYTVDAETLITDPQTEDSLDPFAPAKAFLSQFGVAADDYDAMPYELRVQLLEVAYMLAEIKKGAADLGIPVGFTVGPFVYEVEYIDTTVEGTHRP